jgi:cytochrome c biogenesis protein CcdA
VGPTLGAAAVLASQGKDLGQVAATMLAFGIGAALPLLLLGMLSRQMMLNMRARLMSAGGPMKAVLGALLVIVGLLVVTGLDKQAEAIIVANQPDWLTKLTTRF